MFQIRPGDSPIQIVAGSALTGGTLYLDGGILGVVHGSVGSGAVAVIDRGGDYDVTKIAGTAWADGDLISYNGSAWTKSSTLDAHAVCILAAESSATTGRVRMLMEPQTNPARLTAIEGDVTVVYSGGSATAVTGTASETVTQTATIPAGALEAGDTLLITGGLLANSTTGTETVIGRIRIGGITGPEVARTNAQDVANDDEAGLWGQVNIVTLGAAAASLATGVGFGAWDTAGTVYGTVILASTALDTTAAITVVSKVQASNTGETVTGAGLKVVRIRKAA